MMKLNVRTGLCIAALSASMPFAAMSASMAYVPQSGDGPWEWSDVDNWYNNAQATASQTALSRVPTKNDTVYFYGSQLTSNPVRVSPGTAASCSQFYMTANEWITPVAGDAPIMFEVCGGAITNYSNAWLGYYGNNGARNRSAKISISSGKWTSLDSFNIGGGNRMCWMDIGEDGVLEVPNHGFYVGYSARGGATVTNKGSVTAKDMYLGWNYSWTNGDKTSSTGIVVNAGTMNVTNILAVGNGVKSYASFENRGTLTAYKLYLGASNCVESVFDNYGDITVNHEMRLGTYGAENNPSLVGGMSIYRHHPGATLTHTKIQDYRQYYIGFYSPGRFIIDGGDFAINRTGERFYITAYSTGTGSLEIINGGKFSFDSKNEVLVAYGSRAYGQILVDGPGSIARGTNLYVGNNAKFNKNAVRATGHVIVTNKATLSFNTIYLGKGGGAVGKLTVADGGAATNITELYVGSYDPAAENVTGVSGTVTGIVTIAGADSVVSNVNKTVIGGGRAGNFGLLKMEGGSFYFKTESSSCFNLGLNGSTSAGEIRGWGRIAHHWLGDNVWSSRNIYMSHCGKVIADGEGEERDLDMGNMWSLGENSPEPNTIGCNGWYVRNKGRLRLPHIHEVLSNSRCVGDYAARTGDPRLVNSFRIDFSGVSGSGRHFWADMYSPDRSDIPGGLAARAGSGNVIAVYHIGYFHGNAANLLDSDPTTPSPFTSASIKFHYDPAAAAGRERVRVLRHDGTANGSWETVGRAGYSADSPFVATSEFTESSATWNVGWFALVAGDATGLVITFR